MKPTLKKTAQVLGVKLPRYGDLRAKINGCNVTVHTGPMWKRRQVLSVRVWQCRAYNPSCSAIIETGRVLANMLAMIVQCEVIGTMIDAMPDGRIMRSIRRYISRPKHKLP